MKTRIGALCLLLTACGSTVTTVRLAQPVHLPTGQPVNACEVGQWRELVPVRAFVGAAQVTSGAIPAGPPESAGTDLAVFRLSGVEPEPVLPLLPKMGEPTLQQMHEARVQQILSMRHRANAVGIVSSVLNIAGSGILIGGAASGDSDTQTTTLAVGASTIAVGLITYLVSRAIAPSEQQETFAAVREAVFLNGEDEKAAVERGVNNVNLATRAACSPDGTLPQQPQAQP